MAITGSTLNSLTAGAGQVTVNLTPSSDGAYDETIIYYKERLAAAWTAGTTFTGTGGVAADVIQTGLTNHRVYDFQVFAQDTSDRNSAPSDVQSATPTDGTPAGEESDYLDNLKEIVANSATFQTWIGATGDKVAFARDRIYKEMEPEDDVLKPFALVSHESNIVHENVANNAFITEATMSLFFVDDTDGATVKAQIKNFTDETGKIIEDIKILEDSNGYLAIRGISWIQKPMFTGDNYENDEISCIYEISSGL